MRALARAAFEGWLLAADIAEMLAKTMICRVHGHDNPTWERTSQGPVGRCPRCWKVTVPPPVRPTRF